ncbi:MAG TPA: DUF5666 domain-containing protein [Nitrospiraceae bacterium]|jgi:hypothetical protein
MIRFIAILFLLLTFTVVAPASRAHGPGQHVLGTVTVIDAKHIEVKTQKGKTVDVQLNKLTRYKEKGNPKGTNLPAVGDRVVIEVTKEKDALIATEVHFSAAKKAATRAQ